ncbi:MAG: DUF1822 family protein [Xenococcaceae cyanobacterium]
MNNEHITIFLDRNARRYAQQFAGEQVSPQKGKQVYLNTLAVCAVNTYLKMLSVKTAIDRGDCWNPNFRNIFDTADLVLPDLGKLECRPVLPEEIACLLPPEVSRDRIGYVAVRFNENLERVELLGFINAGATTSLNYANDNFIESISLDRLQSLDALIDRIHQQNVYVNLRQWFAGIFEPQWQPVELLLANKSNFRSTSETSERTENIIERAKTIKLEDEQNSLAVILSIETKTTSTEYIDLTLRIYPSENNYLPDKLQVKILDRNGNACLEVESKDTDNYLQLEFSCHIEEQFNVNLNWMGINIVEQFLS